MLQDYVRPLTPRGGREGGRERGWEGEGVGGRGGGRERVWEGGRERVVI